MSPSDMSESGSREQSITPPVIQPPPNDEDAGFYDKEEQEETELVDPMERYFSCRNILMILLSLAISFFFIFEPQIMDTFWSLYAPEETAEYLINLRNCKIPSLYDGRSELPFMWDLELSQSGNLAKIDFNCETAIQFSEINENMLYLMTKLKKRRCCFRNITRPESLSTDAYMLDNNCKEFTSNGTDVSSSEFLLVQCIHTRNKSIDFGTHALLPNKGPVVEKMKYWSSNYNKKEELPFSVAVIVIASTSRAHAYRSLPDTIKFLEGADGNFVTMNGYQGIEGRAGSSGLSTSNILPLITGVPDTSKLRWTQRWDNFSTLWTKFGDAKYVTMLMDDSKKMLRTFHANDINNGKSNRAKAYKRQPTDYYLKPFLEAHSDATEAFLLKNDEAAANAKKHCIGRRSITSYLLQHLTRFHKKFEATPAFSFSYLSWPQQEHGLESLSKMDATYYDFFQEFLTIPHVKERTAVVIMSDHGLMNHPYFETEHGALEKLNPLLMIKLPQSLVRKHSKYVDNLKVNSHRVVSPIDVHRTIVLFSKIFTSKSESYFKPDNFYTTAFTSRLTTAQIIALKQKKILGKNLFTSEISYYRTCRDAFIPPSMCLCNKSSPHTFNGRVIVSDDGTPEKYWHYSPDSKS